MREEYNSMTDKVMLYHSFNSTFLDRLEYEKIEELLTVFFRNGKEYKYDDVPIDLIEQWADAESAGAFYSRYVKDKFQAPSEE